MHNELTFEECMNKASKLPDGKVKLELLEQAASIADTMEDIEKGFESRYEILDVAFFHGFETNGLVAFAWLQGQLDKYPEFSEKYSLLWKYKVVIGTLPFTPAISRKQIENVLEDMKRRYNAQGYSNRSYHYAKAFLHLDFGEVAACKAELDIALSMERDAMSDCSACEQDGLVTFFYEQGDDTATIQAAEPILQGQLKCGGVPRSTLPKVLLPLLRLGRRTEAEQLERQAYKLIRGDRAWLMLQAQHIGYLVIADPIRGLEVFEEYLALSFGYEEPMDQMFFYGHSANLFSRLSEEKIHYQVKLPQGYPCENLNEDTMALASYFKNKALEIARQFDIRNENNYHVKFIENISTYRLENSHH